MEVTDDDIENLRRISEDVFGDRDYIEIEEVKDTKDDVMVRVNTTDGGTCGARNAFAGSNLRKYHENGYVAVAVGGSDEKHSAWFERADALEFGSPDPDGKYELSDNWYVVAGKEYAVLHANDMVVSHIAREGWTLDEYVLQKVIPAWVAGKLEDLGFESGDVENE